MYEQNSTNTYSTINNTNVRKKILGNVINEYVLVMRA